jgi:hypothetical protein
MEQEANTALKVMVSSIVVMPTVIRFWTKVRNNKVAFSDSNGRNLLVQIHI